MTTYRIAVKSPDDKPEEGIKYLASGRGGEAHTNEPGFKYIEGTKAEIEAFIVVRNGIWAELAEDATPSFIYEAVPFPPEPTRH